MDYEGNYKKPEYFGTAYLIDTQSKQVIVTGQGRFDTEVLQLVASFKHSTMGVFENLMVILQTQDGYFAPLVIFTETFILMGTSTDSYSMGMCLHWSSGQPIESFLDEFKEIDISIKAKHIPTSWQHTVSKDKKESSELIVIKGVSKNIGEASYKAFNISASSSYSTSHSHLRIDDESIMRKRLRYRLFRNDKENFTFRDLHTTIQAFRAHWLLAHEYIDCDIVSVKLGNKINLILSDRKLPAVASNVEQYRPAISINEPLDLLGFAKLAHFYINPDLQNDLSSSSKIGLALNRMIGRRFETTHTKLDYEVTDLIFSLQSIAESVAEKEVSRQNRINKSETFDGITKVLDAIKAIESELPDNVKQFYDKDKAIIYSAISRPSFSRSLEITAEKLDVNLENYKDVLNDIEKARRQVVHSERYDSQFLYDLLTKGTTTIERSEDGTAAYMVMGIKKGSLDHLYDLVLTLLKRYIENYSA